MALAETVLRKVHKLGLIPKLIKLLPVISLLLTISSVSWLLYLPIEGNYRNTYISENALMPAQATSYFRESEWNVVRGYRDEIRKLENEPIEKKNRIIEGWLNNIGLVTSYHQNRRTNDTMYAIMHAPRGDDTEAMVLAVPWLTSEKEYNEGGIALSLALARYFSRLSIWSKNIIIVYPQDGHFSLRSWVESYHTSLEKTAGSIEAAIVMEYGKNGDYFDYYEMNYEGLNGQLPNLDLLNTANLIGYHENLHCSIQSTPSNELTKNTYFTRLRTLIRGILSLTLSGLNKPTPGCEAFSGWQIQSFTIRAKGSNGPADVTQFGRIVDSTFRSVNNLLEKFHQSFFFYLMLSPKYFVSIGTYLPSAILVAVSFALSSLGCLLNSKIEINNFINDLSKLLTIFTSIELGSFVLSILLPYLTKILSDEEFTVTSILYGLVSFSSLICLLPLFDIRFKFRLSKSVSYSLISLSLFFISMLITTLLIVHFSLALLIGYLSLPLTFIQPIITNSIENSQSTLESSNPLLNILNKKKSQIKISLSLLVSNPFFIVYLFGNYVDGDNGHLKLMRGLLTSWDELQCWNWFVIILGWFPAWLGIGLSFLIGDFETNNQSKLQKKLQ